MNIPLLLTSVFIFVSMGSTLFIFFKYKAQLLAGINGNAILAYFVIQYIPTSFSAAIFAATQSTVNSVSTCMTADILEHLRPDITDHQKLSFAKKSS